MLNVSNKVSLRGRVVSSCLICQPPTQFQAAIDHRHFVLFAAKIVVENKNFQQKFSDALFTRMGTLKKQSRSTFSYFRDYINL